MKNFTRRKSAAILATLFLTAALSACAKESGTPATAKSGSAASTTAALTESSKDAATSSAEEELPNWRGVSDHAFVDIGQYTVGDETKPGHACIIIEYPSLKPSSYGFAYQWDPCFVLVSGCGEVEKETELYGGKTAVLSYDAVLEKLEDAFEVNKAELLSQIEYDRRSLAYDNFDFTVESQELMTINTFPVCKYSGTHTYTYSHTVTNDEGNSERITENRASAFVTYAVDTRQLDGNISPYMITIINDNIENPSMDPIPDGLIDKYGVRMIESIKILVNYYDMDYEAKLPSETTLSSENDNTQETTTPAETPSADPELLATLEKLEPYLGNYPYENYTTTNFGTVKVGGVLNIHVTSEHTVTIWPPSGLVTIPEEVYNDILENGSCTFEAGSDTITLTWSEDKNTVNFKTYRGDFIVCEGSGQK